MDPSLIPQLGGTIGLLGAAGFIIAGAWREARDLRKERAEEIQGLKADNQAMKAEVQAIKIEHFACRLQVNSLITFAQRGGLDIPDWLIRGEHES